MKTNYFVKSVLVGLTALSMAGASMAAVTEPAGQGHAKFAEHMAKRQAKLHDKLKLTAAQEPAWATFIASSKPEQAGPRGERGVHADMAKLSAPERMEKWIAMSKERIGVQEGRLASLKTFYAVLTPEQQKVFDDSVPGGKHGGWGRHHGPRDGGKHEKQG